MIKERRTRRVIYRSFLDTRKGLKIIQLKLVDLTPKPQIVPTNLSSKRSLLLKNIKSMVSRQNFETSWAAKMTYQIFEVSESGTLVEYKTRVDQVKVSNERDLQLKSLLDQLDPMDNAVLTIVNMYPTLEKDVKKRGNTLHGLNNIKFEIDNFKKYIIDNKHYFLNLSSDLEWMKAILTIHNFRDCSSHRYYDYSQRKYVTTQPSDELLSTFRQAKLELRKKRKAK